MKHLALLLSLIAISAALSACAMDTTGGFNQGGTTMNGKSVYEPGDIPDPKLPPAPDLPF